MSFVVVERLYPFAIAVTDSNLADNKRFVGCCFWIGRDRNWGGVLVFLAVLAKKRSFWLVETIGFTGRASRKTNKFNSLVSFDFLFN